MRKLVMIHGRSQEGKDPEELKWTWIQALKEGLSKRSLNLPVNSSDIFLPYYGDLLDDLVYGVDTPALDVISRGAPSDREEVEFKVDLLEELAARAGLTEDQIRDASGDPTIARGPFNWEFVQGIMRAFDKHVPAVSGGAVNLFTHDVYLYLRRPGIRDEVDKIVRASIGAGDCVIVGHSLGTIVAYSVLNRDEEQLKIPLLVTVGSPLGSSRIQRAFSPVRSPTSVARWYNAMDERDFVALYPLEPPQFNVMPRVENKTDVDNFTSSHHGIAGYLSDPDVAQEIYVSLTT